MLSVIRSQITNQTTNAIDGASKSLSDQIHFPMIHFPCFTTIDWGALTTAQGVAFPVAKILRLAQSRIYIT